MLAPWPPRIRWPDPAPQQQLENALSSDTSTSSRLAEIADLMRSIVADPNSVRDLNVRALCESGVGFLDALSDQLHPTGHLFRDESPNKDMQKATELISAVLEAEMLKSRARLKEALKRGAQLVVPSLFLKDILALLDEPGRIPSISKVWRARLVVDCAFAVYFRDFLGVPDQSPLVYLWLDCSPMAGHEWLQSRIMRVLCNDLDSMIDLASTMDSLTQAGIDLDRNFRKRLQQYLSSANPLPMNEQDMKLLEMLREKTQAMSRYFDFHFFFPIALGWKAKSLLRIMVAFHHGARHEVHSLANLLRLCHRVFGVMSDMGTELGARLSNKKV